MRRVQQIRAVVWLTLPAIVSTAVAQPEPTPSRGDRPSSQRSMFAALDTDGDGHVSAEEIGNASVSLRKLDENNDGQLSRAEARPPRRRGGGGRERSAGSAALAKPPLPKDAAEKRITGVLDDLDRNQREGMMNVPLDDGRLLRVLAETSGAKHVVEIGTSNGYSTIWICLALRSTGGKITTYEIDEDRAALARENFKRAGVADMVTLVMGDAHDEVTKLDQPIDLLFLDADKRGYVDYLKKLMPLVRPGGLIIAHNMVRPEPDPRFIEAITTNPVLETIFLNMDAAGVSVALKKH